MQRSSFGSVPRIFCGIYSHTKRLLGFTGACRYFEASRALFDSSEVFFHLTLKVINKNCIFHLLVTLYCIRVQSAPSQSSRGLRTCAERLNDIVFVQYSASLNSVSRLPVFLGITTFYSHTLSKQKFLSKIQEHALRIIN